MKKLTPLLIALILFAIVSCSKDTNETSVAGTVVDKTTLHPLSDATVVLLKAKRSCFSCSGSRIANTTSNAKGEYSFDFVGENGFSYFVDAERENYLGVIGGNPIGIKKGEENTQIIRLHPRAFVRLFIKNINPFDGTDVIGTGSFGGGGDTFYGAAVDTILVKGVPGNQNLNLVFHIQKNNITNTFTNNVYTPAFDTTNYTINY